MSRVLGYWVLYMFVGIIVALGGGDVGSEDSRSPVRTSTKVIGAVSGVGIAAALLGCYLVSDPTANRGLAHALAYAGTALALIFTIWCWARLARDLRDR